MKKLTSKTILAATIAGLAVAGGGAAVAASQSDDSSSFFDSVARHLGISSEELEEATRAAALDEVNAALEDGRITEEQAEELRSRIESGEFPRLGPGLFFGFGGPGAHGPGVGHAFGDKLSAAADYLGLTEDELRDRLQDGASLAEIAEAEGKSVDGLKQAILDEARTRLDEAVADERLTQEQADAVFERLEAHVDELVVATGENRRQFHFRFGGHGPWDRGPGFGPPGDEAPDDGSSEDRTSGGASTSWGSAA